MDTTTTTSEAKVTQTEHLNTVNQMAEALKECSAVGQKLIEQRERYAAVAQAAIECIEVMQAHLSYLSAADQKRLATDLKSRGINIESRKSLLGLIARKEG